MVYRFYCMALFHSQTRRHMIKGNVKSGPLHKFCQPCPWSPNGCHYLPMTINKKRHSKTMRPTAYIFCIYQYLVIPCINLANHAPEVQIGQVLRVIYSHKLVLKHMWPTAQVSSITYKQIILCNPKLCNVLFFHTYCLLCLSF